MLLNALSGVGCSAWAPVVTVIMQTLYDLEENVFELLNDTHTMFQKSWCFVPEDSFLFRSTKFWN